METATAVSIVPIVVTLCILVALLGAVWWVSKALRNRRPGTVDNPAQQTPTGDAAARTVTDEDFCRYDSFVDATNGGWGDPPEIIATDGGSNADYVGQQLELARQYAVKYVQIGEQFRYKLAAIPRVVSPHEISFGMMMRASDYGLQSGVSMNETFIFTRIK